MTCNLCKLIQCVVSRYKKEIQVLKKQKKDLLVENMIISNFLTFD